MISTLFLNVFERMQGRKLASIVAAAGDASVTERTVRNWLGKRTTPASERVDRLMMDGRKMLLKNLTGKQWPARESESFVDGLGNCPGFVSAFAFILQGYGGQYPAFLQLSRQIDTLEQELVAHRENGDLRSWVQALLDTEWIRDEHLASPDGDTGGAEATRRQFQEAKSWDDLELPWRVLVLNTLFQLLATLDLEFCACYLSDLEATPLFASLLPRLDPRVDFVGRTTIPTTRDMYHYPFRRLLDATACMRVMRQSPGRKWPRTMPAADEMGTWLELAGRAQLSSNLPKWRSGRALTAARFEDIWDACFQFLPTADRPPAPMPMMYAATVFTELFVKGSREGRELTFNSPDPELYRHWWDIQRRYLTTGPDQLRFGTEKWTPALS